jgi:hypothetical protein
LKEIRQRGVWARRDEVRRQARDLGIAFEKHLLFVVVYKLERSKTKKNCGSWKSGNPKPGFPLFHRPECLRRKEKNGRLHKTLDTLVRLMP